MKDTPTRTLLGANGTVTGSNYSLEAVSLDAEASLGTLRLLAFCKPVLLANNVTTTFCPAEIVTCNSIPQLSNAIDLTTMLPEGLSKPFSSNAAASRVQEALS